MPGRSKSELCWLVSGSGMAACARHEFMLRVIEFRVRHIAGRDVRWRDFRQRRVSSTYKRVALFARLAPQELFASAVRSPTHCWWRQEAIVRGKIGFSGMSRLGLRGTRSRRGCAAM